MYPSPLWGCSAPPYCSLTVRAPLLAGAARCPQLSDLEYHSYSLPYPLPSQRYIRLPVSPAPRPPHPVPHSDISAKLESKALWEKFLAVGTEMILTKGGRRMFPEFSVSVSGLDPSATYALIVEAVPADDLRYKWDCKGWRSSGKGETHLPARLYIHPEAPAPGHHWMAGPVSFSKLKVTNNMLDQGGHLILHSMHRYTLRLCVVRTSENGAYLGAGMLCFDFPETAFIAVTSYQNEKLSQLKIEENPFAKGIKEFKSHRDKHDGKGVQSGKRWLEEEPEVTDNTILAGSNNQRPCSRVPSPACELELTGDHPAVPGRKPGPLGSEPRGLEERLGSPRDGRPPSRDSQTKLEGGLTPLRDKPSPPEAAPRLVVERWVPPRDEAATMCKAQERAENMAATRTSRAGLERESLATGEHVGATSRRPQASTSTPLLWSPPTQKDTRSPRLSPALPYPHYPRMHQAFLEDYGFYFQLESARSAYIGDHMTFAPYVRNSGLPSCQSAYPFVSHAPALWAHCPFKTLDTNTGLPYLHPSEFPRGLAMTVWPPTTTREVQDLFQKYGQQLHAGSSPLSVQQEMR